MYKYLNHFCITVLILLSVIPVIAQQNVKVKYISAGHVYLNAGSLNGVVIGDTVKVIRDNNSIALLKVVFVADNSASCEIISKKSGISVGDKVMVSAKINPKEDSDTTLVKTQRRRRTFKTSQQHSSKSRTRISGYLSAQWYQFIDAHNGMRDFSQPGIRFSLNVRNLWDDSYNIRIRAHSRYNNRTQRFSDNIPQSEWRNRIYQFSFAFENPESAINYKFGRIISNKFSGVGYIDGLQLQHNISANLNWGIFAGTQPEWQYSEFQTSFQKYGTFVNYRHGDYNADRFESTLALAGTYHLKTISREVIFLQNNYNHNRIWNVYQSLELDVNRGWRRDKTGEALSISGLYVNGRYFISNNLNAGISYDNRRNYYTYELRSLADSLFDDAFRQGARLSINARFLKNFRIFSSAGIRKRASSKLTYSYSGGLNITDILNQRINVSARFSGFSNLYTQGTNPSISVSKYFFAGHYIQLGYGNYHYTLKADKTTRLNQFLQFSGELELPLNLFISSDYEYSFGDDSEGHRIIAELGYRF